MSLSQAIRQVAPSASMALTSVMALVGAVKVFTGLGKSVVSMTSHFEDVQAGLKTVTGNAEKGAKLFEDLRKFSFQTTFGVDELASASTQLLNAGVSVGQLNNNLKVLGNLAQGDKTKFAELSSIYAKINLQGKAGAQVLESISNKGIPINDQLKKMGVVGTASVEDINKAFKALTDKGGKFAGAMDNINETIAGKEGFISDTMKEVIVNFGEATGITQAYKSILDMVNSALGTINDALMWINKHPIVQALLSGVFVTILTAIVSLIGVMLVASIKKLIVSLGAVIAKLTVIAGLKAIINPQTALIGVAVAGAVIGTVTALARAYSGLADEAEKAGKALTGIKSAEEVTTENIEHLSSLVEERTKALKEAKENLEKMQVDDGTLGEYQGLYEETTGTLLVSVEDIELQKQIIANREKELETVEKLLQNQESINRSMQEYSKLSSKVTDIRKSTMTSAEKEVESLTSQLEGITDIQNKSKKGEYKTLEYNYDTYQWEYVTKKLTKEQSDALDKAGDRLKKKLEDAKIKVAMEGLEDWKKELQGILSLKDKDLFKTNRDGSLIVDSNGNPIMKSFMQAYIDRESVNNRRKETFENDNFIVSIESLSKDLKVFSAFRDSGQFRMKSQLSEDGKQAFEASGAVTAILSRINTGFEKATDETIGKIAGADKNTITGKNNLSLNVNNLSNTVKQMNDLGLMTEDIFKALDVKLQGTGYHINKLGEVTKDTWLDMIGLKEDTAERQGVEDITSGSDLETFMNSFAQTGNVFMAFVDTVINAIFKVIKNMDGLSDAISPITKIMEGIGVIIEPILNWISSLVSALAPIIKILAIIITLTTPILYMLSILGTLLKGLGEVLSAIADVFQAVFDVIKDLIAYALDPLVNGLKKLADFIRSIPRKISNFFAKVAEVLEKIPIIGTLLAKVANGVSSAFGLVADRLEENAQLQEEEADRLKRLIDQYSSLYSAMKEQELWYLEAKTRINAEGYKESVTKVNDMILTPDGKFSTSPDDYIIATKNPSSLAKDSSITIQMNVNNTVSDIATINARQRTDGNGNVIIDLDVISSQIANDYANGNNGWDSAIYEQQYNMAGREISIG